MQELTDLAKTGINSKLKSQSGSNVEVMVENIVKWPHEYILLGLNKQHVSYDQLSVTQCLAGFGRTMREESNPEIRQHMLDYMISLMDDANETSKKVIQKRLAMGAHKSVFTHRSRPFVNKITCYNDVKTEPSAACGQWLRWFTLSKSLQTMVEQRSYAQVLKDG